MNFVVIWLHNIGHTSYKHYIIYWCCYSTMGRAMLTRQPTANFLTNMSILLEEVHRWSLQNYVQTLHCPYRPIRYIGWGNFVICLKFCRFFFWTLSLSDLKLNTFSSGKSKRDSNISTIDEPVDLNSFATKKTASAGEDNKRKRNKWNEQL